MEQIYIEAYGCTANKADSREMAGMRTKITTQAGGRKIPRRGDMHTILQLFRMGESNR